MTLKNKKIMLTEEKVRKYGFYPCSLLTPNVFIKIISQTLNFIICLKVDFEKHQMLISTENHLNKTYTKHPIIADFTENTLKKAWKEISRNELQTIYESQEPPKYVKMLHTTMRLRENRTYYRDRGDWFCYFDIKNDSTIISRCSVSSADKIELLAISEEEWKQGNWPSDETTN